MVRDNLKKKNNYFLLIFVVIVIGLLVFYLYIEQKKDYSNMKEYADSICESKNMSTESITKVGHYGYEILCYLPQSSLKEVVTIQEIEVLQ